MQQLNVLYMHDAHMNNIQEMFSYVEIYLPTVPDDDDDDDLGLN